MSAKPRTTPKDLVLSVPLARRPGARPADCREPYRQFESGSVFLRYQGLAGGWGGIRTHEKREPLPVFKTGPFNHSGTHPVSVFYIISNT